MKKRRAANIGGGTTNKRSKRAAADRAAAAAAPAADKRTSSDDAQLLPALGLLQRRREPYGEAIAGIIADVLARFPPPPGKPLVEIGAGIGQLGSWLAAPLRDATIYTDPARAALRVLRSANPDARVVTASALALPFANGACAAVLALCVFDAIAEADQPAVARELARILPPGGRFIHFLDMATLLDAPFRKLAAAGMVPIPNVFSDPGDEEWPLDIYLVNREWLTGLLDFAVRTAHPLAAAFGQFFAAFLRVPAFDLHVATDQFKALASDGARRQALAILLGSASRLAAQWGHPPVEMVAFHSGKYLASVLQTTFANDGAFDVRMCELRTHLIRTTVPASDSSPSYRSLCLGHQRVMERLPARMLTSPEEMSAAGTTQASTYRTNITEAGILVFIAERR
ncbi:MAG: class I SAM-dependent methyltransferase [Myxococcales bacterium]